MVVYIAYVEGSNQHTGGGAMRPIKSSSQKRGTLGVRAFERREAGGYPYYRLARWDDRNCVWRDVKGESGTEAGAVGRAGAGGRYRVTKIEEDGPVDLEPFTA